jgi:hypothetical protein
MRAAHSREEPIVIIAIRFMAVPDLQIFQIAAAAPLRTQGADRNDRRLDWLWTPAVTVRWIASSAA